MKDSLGAYLKREREIRRVSVQDISQGTRLNETWIRALEDNRLDVFSQIEYVPGYLKLYSAHLGLDYQEVLDRAQREFIRLPGKKTGLRRSADYPKEIRKRGAIGKPGNGRIQGSDRMIKRGLIALFTIFMISLFFFIPAEYKGPDAIRSEVSKQPATTHAGNRIPNSNPGDVSTPSSRNEPLPVVNQSLSEETAAKTIQVIGNSDSKRYHLPGMKYYDQVKAYHRVVFRSEEEAIQAGYHKAPR